MDLLYLKHIKIAILFLYACANHTIVTDLIIVFTTSYYQEYLSCIDFDVSSLFYTHFLLFKSILYC